MALIVEDGTGLADANAYIDVAYADNYFGLREIGDWSGDTPVKEAAIIRATDYIGVRWGDKLLGRKLHASQALDFPRQDLWYQGARVTGVPDNVKRATAEYALRALGGELMPDPVVDETGLQVNSRREKVGPIEEEVSYATFASAATLLRPYPAADRLIAIYAVSGGRNYR